MNYFAWTGLINGSVSALCAIFVIVHNPRGIKNRICSLYFLSILVWSYFYCLWQIKQGDPQALIYARGLMMGAIFIPIFQYHSILSSFDLYTPKRRKILWTCYLLTFFFAISNVTPLFITRVEHRLFFQSWPVPGPLFHPYLLMFVWLILESLKLIWSYRKEASPVTRNQIFWTVTGISLSYIGGASNFLLWYNIPVAPYLNITVIAYIVINALLFYKLSLFDFQLFIRDSTVHLIVSLILGGVYALATFPLVHDSVTAYLIILFSLGVPLFIDHTQNWVRNQVNRTRLGKIDRYLSGLDANIGKVRETSFTREDLAKNLVNAILGTFPVSMAAVYFLNREKKQFELWAQKGMKNSRVENLKLNREYLSITTDDDLINHIQQKMTITTLEELDAEDQNPMKEKISNSFTRIEAEACVPFLVSERLEGMLALGRKMDGGLFHKEDLSAVDSFRRMGEDVIRYIIGLEHEARHAALYSHDMNNDTKSLLQMLQFIRSPLGEQISIEKRNDLLTKAEDVAARLNQSFQLNRDRSSRILRFIKGEYEKESVDVRRLMEESINKFTLAAKDKNIEFHIELPDKPVIIEGNSNDLIRIMDNLIGNAFRYVKTKGTVTIIGKEFSGGFYISVTDDGQGIDPNVIERIWELGWQVKDSKQGASGLGLSIVKQIVEFHNGTIRAQSEGAEKGTKFEIWLPQTSNNSKQNDVKEAA